jgi:hypothetical protein
MEARMGIVPVNGFKIDPRLISNEEREAIKALLEDRGVKVEVDEYYLAGGDYYVVVMVDGVPETHLFSPCSIASKQIDLGLFPK